MLGPKKKSTKKKIRQKISDNARRLGKTLRKGIFLKKKMLEKISRKKN
jgi:hypothetical protein